MHGPNNQDILRFFVAGINYKKTDAEVRGQFAVAPENYEIILSESSSKGISEVFVLSTCNRTEIYGLASDAAQLVDLLCKYTAGSKETFLSRAYIRQGKDAITHLYNVSAGLDSQILGDYEIVGQIKQAVKFAKQHQRIGAFMERLVNSVLQSSKHIKNQTALSGGTVSVSFSAVQYLRNHVKDIADKRILLSGIGKIGRNTCRNLVDYLPVKNITLINRTDEKAQQLAKELGLSYAPFTALSEEVHKADIILVATNAQEPTILTRDLQNGGSKVIIDLSIPYNVEASAKSLPGVTVVNVDELSKLKDSTLDKRRAEIPKANHIIAEHIQEFMEWHEMRKYVPVLRAVKTKLREIHGNAVFFNYSTGQCTAGAPLSDDHEERIQKVINVMAVKMRRQNQKGCHYIEAINEFIAPGVN